MLFLDIVPISFDSLLARCVDVFVEDLSMSSRFISNQMNIARISFLIFWFIYNWERELRLSVCFNAFRSFNRSLTERRMSHSQIITTEWTAEKWFDKRVQSKKKKKTRKNTSKATEQTDGRKCRQTLPSSKMQRFNIQTTNLAEEFRFNQCVYTFRNIP